MNLFSGVPFIIPDPAAEQRENAKIGMQFASMFGDSFKSAQSNATHNRQIDLAQSRWNAESAMRDAQLKVENARLKKLEIDTQNEARIAENEAKMSGKQAEFAALNEQIESTGWTNPYSKDMYYNFLTRNPEFVNTEYTKAMEEKFAKADAIERQREYWQQKNAAILSKEQLRQDASKEKQLEDLERDNLNARIRALQNNEDLRDNPKKLREMIDQEYANFRANGNRVIMKEEKTEEVDNKPGDWQQGPGFRFRVKQ